MVNSRDLETFNAVSDAPPSNNFAANESVNLNSSNEIFHTAKSSQSSSLPSEFGNADKFRITNSGADYIAAGDAQTGNDKTPSKNDKSIKPLDSPQYDKLSPEQQTKAAKEIAADIADKGFTDRAVRDNLRTKMLQVYLGGEKDSQGDEKAMNDFVKQVNDNLPKGMSLKMAKPENDADYKNFLKNAGDQIAKQPGMQMGANGQIQLWKNENGQDKMIAKTHYAATIRKQAPVKV